MANIEAVGGSDSFVIYAKETTYATEATTAFNSFGLVKSFKPNITNNQQKLRGFAGSSGSARDVARFVAGKLESSASVDFDVLEWSWLEGVMGSVSGSGSPYAYPVTDIPPSYTIHGSIVNPGSASTAQDLLLLGSVIDSVTIKCAVGEPVSVSINFVCAKPQYDTTNPSNVALSTNEVYNFAGAAIQLPTGTTISNIADSVEITIKNNWEILFGLGSRLGVAAKPKERDYTIKFTLKYLNNDWLGALLGATTPIAGGGPTNNATFTVMFTQGATKNCSFNFANFQLDDETINHELNQVITEDISGTAKTLTIADYR
jgi:hypothetical protein